MGKSKVKKIQKVKKVKKPTRSKLVKELDRVFSLFIRQRDLPGPCYTCGTYTTVEGGHAMHFISRAHYRYRWDEDNVKGGCPRCNIWLKGNYVPFTLNMIRDYGKERVEEMERMKNVIHKVTDGELMDKIQHYKSLIKEDKKQYSYKKYEEDTAFPTWGGHTCVDEDGFEIYCKD